jgi:hypothetical protein
MPNIIVIMYQLLLHIFRTHNFVVSSSLWFLVWKGLIYLKYFCFLLCGPQKLCVLLQLLVSDLEVVRFLF